MDTENKQTEELEPGRWIAHRATEVTLTETGVFHLRKASRRSEQETLETVRRSSSDPFGPLPAPHRHEGFTYEPLERRTLPNALARIAAAADQAAGRSRGTGRRREQHAGGEIRSEKASWRVAREAGQAAERAAIKEITHFYRHYGELGFRELRPRDGWPDSGEPLGWVLAEAQTVRFALALIDALNRDDTHDLKATLTARRLDDRHLDEAGKTRMARHGLVGYAVCRDARHHGHSVDPATEPWPSLDVGWYDPTVRYQLRGTDEAAHREHAGAIVADLIRHHLPERENDFLWREGRFIEVPRSGPLLSAVWLHVKDTALDRVAIERCRECGAPFIVTDRRQHFCPPDRAGGKSRCLARLQMRRARRRGHEPTEGEEAQS